MSQTNSSKSRSLNASGKVSSSISKSRSFHASRKFNSSIRRMVFVFLILGMGGVCAAGPRILASFQDDFTSNPLTSSSWVFKGLNSVNTQPAYPPLMSWDAASSAILVTWDQSKPSSSYGIPLGCTVTEQDDFSFSFVLRLDSVTNPVGDYFEIAVGLDDSSSTRTRAFDRSGKDFFDPADPRRCKNIVEWNWVPRYSVWGGGEASYIIPTICPDPGAGGDIFRNHFGMVSTMTELQPGHVYEITQTYKAAARTFSLAMRDNGTSVTTEDVTTSVTLAPSDTFTVDRFGIRSYHNRYAWGSWEVKGRVDDARVIVNGETVVSDDFPSDPSGAWKYEGLREYGLPQPDLAAYDPAHKRLAFTWDANRPCTALSHKLAAPVTDLDNFAFEFDLELSKVDVNGEFFEIAFGLHNSADHLFDRGGKNFSDPNDPTRCKNIADWNWVPRASLWGGGTVSYIMSALCPDPGTGPDIFLGHWGYVSSTTELTTGTLYHVRQEYRAATREFSLTMTAGGTPIQTEDVTTAIQVPAGEHFRMNCVGPVSYFNSWAFLPGDWKVSGWIDNVRFEQWRPEAAARPEWQLY